MSEQTFPKCEKCEKGVLIPLSDFSNNAVSIKYKAWACTNQECRFFIVLRGGDVYYGTATAEAAR
ncbi:MAG: hypothetical protein KKF06_05230 [Candidatus Margulisbacteria bacterium]|nr:hypothetical protein [Candidatus Margulisiibacteriota bacterium]MBU1867300.1 hypothetical protein [Candidatus Margulisiibacteriota bacterium]